MGANRCAVPAAAFWGSEACPAGEAGITRVDLGEGRAAVTMRGVRPDSVYTKCGFRDGDVWQSLNGMPLNAPDDAMKAFLQVARARHLTFVVARDRVPVTIDVDIL